MKAPKRRHILALCLSLSLCPSAASAQEQRVRMKDLPPAVQATVKEQSKGARVRGLAREIENGKTFYEVSLFVNGHGKDVLMDADGNVVEIEEQVALNTLPAAVRTALRKAAGKGRMMLVETVSKNGAFVFYEAHVNTRGKVTEIKVGTDGRTVQ